MRSLTSVARKLAYILAACIIFAAAVVSTTHLFTPILNSHKADIEDWAGQLLHMPVTIRSIDLSWSNYQPVMSLNGVTLSNVVNKQPALQILKVKILFSILDTLMDGEVVPSGIVISGTEVNLHQEKNGDIRVQGFPMLADGLTNEPFHNETKFNDIVAWLSAQPHIYLKNIDVRYAGKNNLKRYVTLYHLELENSHLKHVISAKAILHQQNPTELTAAIQWDGSSVDLANINAKIYLYANDVSLAQWSHDFNYQSWQLNNGFGSAKIWASWEQGSFTKIQSLFELHDIVFYSPKTKLNRVINRVSGNVGWRKEENAQTIAGEDILIDLPNHLWPVTSFYFSLQKKDGSWLPKIANIGYIDLKDATTWLTSQPSILSPQILALFTNLQPSGNLQQLGLSFAGAWTDWQKLSLAANINHLSIAEWKNFPAFKNLSANMKWDGKEGSTTLSSKLATLDYKQIFAQPILFSQVDGNLNWRYQLETDTWEIHSPAIQLFNDNLSATVSGALTIIKSEPVADLKANFNMSRVSQITHYLPLKIFDNDLSLWLSKAFSAGRISAGNAIFRGSLNAFPFDHDNGIFEVTGTVENADLHYADGWPDIKNIFAHVSFTGRQMQVDATRAAVLGIAITNTHGFIPDLGDEKSARLSVKSDPILLDVAEGLQFIHQSELEKTFGKKLADMKLTGPITLNLSLNVPLSDPSNANVQGEVDMTQTRMTLPSWNLIVDNLSGKLAFTEDSLSAQHLNGKIFNKPVDININTIKNPQANIIQAKAQTNIAVTDLETWLHMSLAKTMEGATDVTTEIDLTLNNPMIVKLNSNLIGIKLNLPAGFAKTATQVKNLSAEMTTAEKDEVRVKLNYTNEVNAALILRKQKNAFKLLAADLRLGKGEAAWPKGEGLYISGEFNDLDWEKIKSYVDESSQAQFSDLPFRGVDITARSLKIATQHLTQVHLQVEPTKNDWNIDIASPEAEGKIIVPKNFSPKDLLKINFDKLLLAEGNTKDTLEAINVKNLPSISFFANRLIYNGMSFGQVKFEGGATGKGILIKQLSMRSPYFRLQADGEWTGANLTHLQGEVTASNVSAAIKNFGIDAHNLVSTHGKVGFDLAWDGAPFAPSLSSLNGSASLTMGAGRIVDVGRESESKMDIGRMLSLFSLQTIPRRLSLDFSDLAQKGYSFDFVRGDFNFKKGSAYTQNLQLDGPVAKIGINGRIGLENKDYDLTLSVTPNLTGSIPVAATLITWQPLIGLAALAVNTVIGPQVSKVGTSYYAVHGPWRNPSWEQIKTAKQR